jgi:hypothetical protein
MKEHLKDYIEKSDTASVRGLRILLEYFYATEIFEEIAKKKIKIISVFGSARAKANSKEYRHAFEIGKLLYQSGFAVVTGASCGLMQAANQGVADTIAHKIVRENKLSSLEAARKSSEYRNIIKHHSVGLSISLPMESESNPFVGVNATFHYFMVRKFFFATLSSGFIACEGGWGTRDELYEMLTLVQTGKARLLPIVYMTPDPRHLEQDIQHAMDMNYVSPMDRYLIQFAKTPARAVEIIRHFYRQVVEVIYEAEHTVKLVLRKTPTLTIKKAVEKMIDGGYEGNLSIEWSSKALVLHQYIPRSYGSLRRAIDVLNEG